MSDAYAHPEMLVTTEWVAQHLDDQKVKIVEVDVDAGNYQKGHIRNAIGWNWQTDLNDPVRRDIINAEQFAELNRAAGVGNDDTVVFYGDSNNWFAAWALWQFKYYRHKDVRLMNGGRKKWELEQRPMVQQPPSFARSDYQVPKTDQSVRAYRDEVKQTLNQDKINLVDVRSPDEFSGKVIAPPGMTETAARRAHPRGQEHSVVQGGQRGWDVQDAAAVAAALRRGGGEFRQADDRVLPHRRALESHVVRAEVPAWR